MKVKDYLQNLKKCDNNVYLMHSYLFNQVHKIRTLKGKKRETEVAEFKKLLGVIAIPDADLRYFKRLIEELNVNDKVR